MGEQRQYQHVDRGWNIRAISDQAGNVLERYVYSPFGRRTVLTANGGAVHGPASAYGQAYGYTGQRYDETTGLHYFKNRYLEPELGRFISRDPAGYVDGMSLYMAYFVLTGTDPLGLTREDVAIPPGVSGYMYFHSTTQSQRQEHMTDERSRNSYKRWQGRSVPESGDGPTLGSHLRSSIERVGRLNPAVKNIVDNPEVHAAAAERGGRGGLASLDAWIPASNPLSNAAGSDLSDRDLATVHALNKVVSTAVYTLAPVARGAHLFGRAMQSAGQTATAGQSIAAGIEIAAGAHNGQTAVDAAFATAKFMSMVGLGGLQLSEGIGNLQSEISSDDQSDEANKPAGGGCP